MNPYRDINDEEWQRIAPLLPELRPRSELRGRPLANTRSVLNGVLWVMYSGATWSAMPRRYPSYQTCHRRFKAAAIGLGILQQGFAAKDDAALRSMVVQNWYGVPCAPVDSFNLFCTLVDRLAEHQIFAVRVIDVIRG
jgi:transposase